MQPRYGGGGLVKFQHHFTKKLTEILTKCILQHLFEWVCVEIKDGKKGKLGQINHFISMRVKT